MLLIIKVFSRSRTAGLNHLASLGSSHFGLVDNESTFLIKGIRSLYINIEKIKYGHRHVLYKRKTRLTSHKTHRLTQHIHATNSAQTTQTNPIALCLKQVCCLEAQHAIKAGNFRSKPEFWISYFESQAVCSYPKLRF